MLLNSSLDQLISLVLPLQLLGLRPLFFHNIHVITFLEDPETMLPDNNKASPLEGGHYTIFFGMWTLKHGISSPKLY